MVYILYKPDFRIFNRLLKLLKDDSIIYKKARIYNTSGIPNDSGVIYGT